VIRHQRRKAVPRRHEQGYTLRVAVAQRARSNLYAIIKAVAPDVLHQPLPYRRIWLEGEHAAARADHAGSDQREISVVRTCIDENVAGPQKGREMPNGHLFVHRVGKVVLPRRPVTDVETQRHSRENDVAHARAVGEEAVGEPIGDAADEASGGRHIPAPPRNRHEQPLGPLCL